MSANQTAATVQPSARGDVMSETTATISPQSERTDVQHESSDVPSSKGRRRRPFARGKRDAKLEGGTGTTRAAPAEKGDEGSPQERTDDETFPSFPGDLPWSQRSWLYEFKPFRGMYYDLKRRAPYYVSDWTDTFAPRNWWIVCQTVIRIYFIK